MVRAKTKIDELSETDRKSLVERLLKLQDKKCYLCGENIDLDLDKVAIDHIIPITNAPSLDNESNWALVHLNCNSEKEAKDMRLARILLRYKKDKKNNSKLTLKDVLSIFGGSKKPLRIKIVDNKAILKYEDGDQELQKELEVYEDKKNSFKSIYTVLPIEYIFHDSELNPRGIGDNVKAIIDEFFHGNPQLHVCLCRITIQNNEGQVLLFDGQHKATAQIYDGVRHLPVRVFINPDKERLKEVNRRAHKELRQIEFFKSILDELGSDIFADEFKKFLDDPENRMKSEKAFIDSLPYDRREEMKGYLKNNIKAMIKQPPKGENKFFKFVEQGAARSKVWPISYDSVEKTVFHFFVDLTPCEYELPKEENEDYVRILERDNVIRLTNLIADKVLIEFFDESIGVFKIEDRLQKGENIPEYHLRAYRIFRPRVFLVWCEFLAEAIGQILLIRKRINKNMKDKGRIFWVKLAEEDWQDIERMIDALASHKIWMDKTKVVSNILIETHTDKVRKFLEQGEIEGLGKVLDEPIDTSFFTSALNN